MKEVKLNIKSTLNMGIRENPNEEVRENIKFLHKVLIETMEKYQGDLDIIPTIEIDITF